MATTRQRVDKNTFKQIFRDHWGPFQQGHPRYRDRPVQGGIDKMLGCGTPESGYTTYLCPHGLEEKQVAFSCKSSFCLSCCKVYVEEWVAHIGRTLYEGVAYRHTVLTMPDALHLEFYRDRPRAAARVVHCRGSPVHRASRSDCRPCRQERPPSGLHGSLGYVRAGGCCRIRKTAVSRSAVSPSSSTRFCTAR